MSYNAKIVFSDHRVRASSSADFVGDPGLRPGSREKVRAVRAGPVGCGRARVVECSLYRSVAAAAPHCKQLPGRPHRSWLTATNCDPGLLN